MEHQDRADSFEEGAQQNMGSTEIERIAAGANDGRFHRSSADGRAPTYHAARWDEFTPDANFAGG
jgi:hypothetical protein